MINDDALIATIEISTYHKKWRRSIVKIKVEINP